MDRFDLVVAIDEILKKYVDCCAVDNNTLGMIQDIGKYLKQLEAIEKEIYLERQRKPKEKEKISSLLEEFRSKNEDVYQYLSVNPKTFKKTDELVFRIKELNKQLKDIVSLVEILGEIKKRMRLFKEKI